MDLLTDETYAYLAGLIDGDGSITIVNKNGNNLNKKSYRIQLCIYNCNIKIINHLITIIGGKVRSNNINRAHSKWRNCNEYSANDKRAFNLISKILPYLIIKKKQALIALEANSTITKHNGAEKRWRPELKIECNNKLTELKKQINELNVRGTQKKIELIDIKNIPFNANYLAGFCDADGSILITKMGKQLQAKITFTNTDSNIIDWIRCNLGGNLYTKIRKNKKWNISYELTFSANKAYSLANILYPLLLIKKRQAKLIMTFGKIKKIYNGATLRWNKTLNLRHRKLQEKIKLICSKLNKKSIIHN